MSLCVILCVRSTTDAREAGHSPLLLSIWANTQETPVPSLRWLVINSLERILRKGLGM